MSNLNISEKAIWHPSEKLSDRIKSLREEYFSFYDRYDVFTNEVLPFTTGKEYDEVYSFINWGVTPEGILFFQVSRIH